MLRIRFYLTRLQLNLGVDMTGLVSREHCNNTGTAWVCGSIDG
jgi:hypothetical protein